MGEGPAQRIRVTGGLLAGKAGGTREAREGFGGLRGPPVRQAVGKGLQGAGAKRERGGQEGSGGGGVVERGKGEDAKAAAA